MIVATHMGMYMPALRPDWEKCLERGEPELQVRARRKIDLLNLREFAQLYGIEIGEVYSIPRTDYQFRLNCTRVQWGHLLAELALEIDYVKFKDTPKKYHGDDKLTDCYGRIWNAALTSFPTGSVYDFSRGRRTHRSGRQTGKSQQQQSLFSQLLDNYPDVDEVVMRTETSTRAWTMKGSTPEKMAELMREIDAATDGVELPSDEKLSVSLEEWESILNTDDHSQCTHSDTKSARKRCRKARRT